MPRPVLALEIGRTGPTRSCLCGASMLLEEARQGTSEISKQDHFSRECYEENKAHLA